MERFETRQNTLLASPEGMAPTWPFTKMGIPVVGSKWDALALGGFMFNAHENTIGTPLTGQAIDAGGIVLTAPAIRLTVPSGKVMLPRRLNLSVLTAAGTLNEAAVVVSDGDSYTSGGTALITPLNWRTDDPRATALTNRYHCSGSAIVEAALTSPRKLFGRVLGIAFQAAAEPAQLQIDKEWDDFIPIVGPASFLVYLGAAGTALTYEFSLDWAEIDSVNV